MLQKKIIMPICIAAAFVGCIAATAALTRKDMLKKQEDYKTAVEQGYAMLRNISEADGTEKLQEHLKKITEEDATGIVDRLLYATYSAAGQYVLSDEETNEINAVLNGCVPELEKIENDEIRTKLTDLKNREHITVRYVNGQMFYDVDYGYFIDSFGDRLLPDYKMMLEFYEREKTRDYSDTVNDTLYTEEVISRLETLRSLKEMARSDLKEVVEESYRFYQAVYLGAYNQGYIFSDGRIRPEILESYRAYAEKCQDEDLKQFLKELDTDYSQVSGTRTVEIFEKIKNFCGR